MTLDLDCLKLDACPGVARAAVYLRLGGGVGFVLISDRRICSIALSRVAFVFGAGLVRRGLRRCTDGVGLGLGAGVIVTVCSGVALADSPGSTSLGVGERMGWEMAKVAGAAGDGNRVAAGLRIKY